MDQHVHGFAGGVLGIEPEQGREQVRTVVKARGLLVDHFDFVALQDGYVDVLFGFSAALFHHQQTGRDDFKHETERREVARSAPDEELAGLAPDGEVNAGALDGVRA